MQNSQPKFTKAERDRLFNEVFLQPWFVTLETSWAIRRLLPPDYIRKLKYYFEDYGCLRCGAVRMMGRNFKHDRLTTTKRPWLGSEASHGRLFEQRPPPKCCSDRIYVRKLSSVAERSVLECRDAK